MKEAVRQSIVSSARRNMRAHALAWREATQWHHRAEAAQKLSRATLWRDTANRIAALGSVEPQQLAA